MASELVLDGSSLTCEQLVELGVNHSMYDDDEEDEDEDEIDVVVNEEEKKNEEK